MNNSLSSAILLAATNQAAGKLSRMVMPLNAGTARVELRGGYTGTVTRDYIVRVSQTGPDLYRWSDDGGDTWSGDLVISPNAWNLLSHSVQFRFVAGPVIPGYEQIYVGDEFRWKGVREWGPENLLDLNRNTEFRTTALSSGLGFQVQYDLGSAKAPAGLAIFDHNFPAGTGISLLASTSGNFAAPNFSQVVPWTANKIKHILTGGPHSYRYWGLAVTLATSVTYLRMSELFLGDVITMSLQFSQGYTGGQLHLGESPREVKVRGPGALGTPVPHYVLPFRGMKAGPGGDLEKLRTLRGFTRSTVNRSDQAFFLNFDSQPGLEIFEMVTWEGELREDHIFLDRVDVDVELTGSVRAA